MGARDLFVLLRSGASGAGNMATIMFFLTSWNAAAGSSLLVVVANYQDYAKGARRVLGPDVVVKLLALAPASTFSSAI